MCGRAPRARVGAGDGTRAGASAAVAFVSVNARSLRLRVLHTTKFERGRKKTELNSWELRVIFHLSTNFTDLTASCKVFFFFFKRKSTDTSSAVRSSKCSFRIFSVSHKQARTTPASSSPSSS